MPVNSLTMPALALAYNPLRVALFADFEGGGHDYVMGACPRAELAARNLINLPNHPRVRPEDVEVITSPSSSEGRRKVPWLPSGARPQREVRR